MKTKDVEMISSRLEREQVSDRLENISAGRLGKTLIIELYMLFDEDSTNLTSQI